MNKAIVQKINLQLHSDDGDNQGDQQNQANQSQGKADNGGESGTDSKSKSDDGNGKDDKSKPKYTEEDLNRLIDEKLKSFEEKQKGKSDEAARLAQMNAQERAEYERDKLQKQVDELLKEKSMGEMQSTAREMLSAESINAPDEIVKLLVTDDAEGTKKTVNAFVSLFKSSVKNAVADALKGKSPKVGTDGTITKEDIMKIKDTKARQKAIKDNIELFQ